MKKLLNILFVKRAETENKWWNRLFNVFLGATAIMVLLSAFFLTLDSYNHNWVTYDPVAFSLESNYQQTSGKEFLCNWSIDDTRSANEPIKSIIECKGVDIPLNDARRYGALYDTANKKLRQTDGIEALSDKYVQICKDEVSAQTFPTTYTGTLTPALIAQIRCVDSREKADPSYNQLYEKYQNDLKSLAYIKVARNVHIGSILGDIALLVLIPLLSVLIWILFWSSIIYRSVLYIVFGNKK